MARVSSRRSKVSSIRKRISGENLFEILKRIARGDQGTIDAYPLARRLGLLADAFQALADLRETGVPLAPFATARNLTPTQIDALIGSLSLHRVARPPEQITFHPQLSAFQYAACRMGWSLADCETVTAHGRPPEQVLEIL